MGLFDDGGKKTVVRVVYSDESGTGSIEQEPLLVVAAMFLNVDSQWTPIQRELDVLAPKKNYEFHGARLFRDLRNGRKRKQADSILRGVLALPGRYSLPIVCCAIDRMGFKRNIGNKPHAAREYEMAFFLCVDLVDSLVHTFFPAERVLWIADHSGHYEQQLKRSHELAKYFQEAVDSEALARVFPQKKAHVSPMVDTVYFGHSHESRALQLVDVCCSVITLHLRGVAIAARYYELIAPQIVNGPVPVYFKDEA